MIRIGCLGAARITPKAIILPTQAIEDVVITAVAARHVDRATSFARRHRIANVEADYEALIRRPDVDLVYNALPPSRHADLSIMALDAGKAVLCEKPFAMNAIEAMAMAEAADRTGGFLIEAFHYRFHPAFQQALDIVRGGDLGRVQSFHGVFSVEIPDRDGEIRHQRRLGGGAMMDLGCYPLHWARSLLVGEPNIQSAKSTVSQDGVDLSMHADLIFDGGVAAKIETAMGPGVAFNAALTIIGTEGSLHFQNPLAPHLGYQMKLTPNGAKRPIIVAEKPRSRVSTYHHQLEHVVSCIKGETSPLLTTADAVANMKAIDGIYRAAGLMPCGLPNDTVVD